MLADAAARVGHPAVRNRGTVGGNLAFADPANNLPVVAVALDAELTVRSAGGERTIAAADFFRAAHTTALEPGELLCAVRFPGLPEGAGSAYYEVSARTRGWGLAGAAAALWLAEDGRIAGARVALGGVGDVAGARRRRRADRRRAGAEAFAAAGAAAREAVAEPRADLHASARAPPAPGRRRRRASAAGGERPRGREGVMDADVRAIELTVNGRKRHVAVEPRRLLSDCLREDLGLTGTNLGCEQGVCGSCTVLGRRRRPCARA